MSRGPTTANDHQTATIDLRAESLGRLFHSLDPGPLAHRALAPEVSAYLIEQVSDAPKGAGVRVCIRLPQNELTHETEVRDAFRRHFERSGSNARRRLREHFARGAVMVVVALACAAVLLALVRLFSSLTGSRFLTTMAGWITVVIWVVLWRPTEILLHDWWPIRHDRVLARRLSEAQVTCAPLEPR